MRYPAFYEMYRAAIKNTWTVEEVDFSTDVADLRAKMTDAERHLIQRLVAFFATGDSIVANNLVLNLYKHINAPEARMYLSRQLYEEALHVQFYLTLLDTYIPDPEERVTGLRRRREHPVHPAQGRVLHALDRLDPRARPRCETREDRRQFLLNLICFAACIEGLFFFAAFAYVYFLRSRGLLHGLAAGTNWVFRDESAHMAFAFEVVDTVRREEPELFDGELRARRLRRCWTRRSSARRSSPRTCSAAASPGLSPRDMRQYLEYFADQRLATLGPAAPLRREEPVRLHGPAGRAGARELLRAPRLGLPGRRDRRSGA